MSKDHPKDLCDIQCIAMRFQKTETVFLHVEGNLLLPIDKRKEFIKELTRTFKQFYPGDIDIILGF